MPYNITQVDFFSMENISVQKVGSSMLEVKMPRLVQGEGSVTTLNLTAEEPTLAEGNAYNVYSIFDQGSTKGKVYHSILEVEGGEWAPLRLFGFGLLISSALVLYILFLPWLIGRSRKNKLSRFVREVYSNYIKSDKGQEDKIIALVNVQRIMSDLEEDFVAKIMKKKMREDLNKIPTENFQRILADVGEFSTNADKTVYKLGLKRLLRLKSKELHIEDDVLAETDRKIDDYIKTL